MHLHCLGTTGYHPSPTRHTACYYLPELSLLLDAGTGLFRLTELLMQDPKTELDIVLSHAHLDHVIGLTFLLDVMALTPLKHVRVYGQPDKLAAVKDHLFHPLLFPVPCNCELIPLPGQSGTVELAGCQLEYFPLNHPGGSIGMILSAHGKRLAYVTDTTPQSDEKMIGRLTDLDLLLHECYFGDEHQEFSLRTGHSWLGAVQSIVKKTKPKQALLIHINPMAELINNSAGLTSVSSSGDLKFAHDGMCVEF
jgi:ribonuclease Z